MPKAKIPDNPLDECPECGHLLHIECVECGSQICLRCMTQWFKEKMKV